VMRYESQVSNTGGTTAGAVPLRLTVDGDVVDTVSLSLGPHETRTVVIRGPECRRLARVEADPAKTIAETSETDNAHELACATPARL
jgi:subtilase family serine protease